MEHAKDLLCVICSFPDPETARQIGTVLIETQLAACVSFVPGAQSIYRWQGHTESATETLAWIKTTKNRYPALEQQILALHPYETPELVALAVDRAAPAYAAWVRSSTCQIP